MAYTTIDLVRSVTGLTTDEVSDVDINKFIPIADKNVEKHTGKSWSSSDADYPLVQLASSWLVGELCYRRLHGSDEKAKTCLERANEILDKIVGSFVGMV